MSNRYSVIFIKPANSSFILSDQHILEKHFRVVPFLMHPPKHKWNFLRGLFEMMFFLLKNGKTADAFICWFGDYHAAVMVLVARLLGKKSVVIAGGQEAICYKELGKGVYQGRVRGWCVKFALRNASLILPNHKSLLYHENKFYNSENPHIDGIYHYVGKIKARVEVIPNGIDFTRINRNPEIPKDSDLVLTVGTMSKTADFYNKGFDLFIELARAMPERKFVMIGVNRGYLDWMEEQFRPSELANLTVIPSYCPDDILSRYFNEAKIYLQVSITEGMPVSLGEAMLCECIPVGSKVNGIPDAMGNTGVIVEKRDIASLKSAVGQAFGMETGIAARRYTLEHFSLELRETRLITALKAILS